MFNAKQTAIHLTDLESALSESNYALQCNAQRKCMGILIKANARINVIPGSEFDFKKFSDNRYFNITLIKIDWNYLRNNSYTT